MLPRYSSTSVRPFASHGMGSALQNIPLNPPAPGVQYICSPSAPEVSIKLAGLPSLRTLSCTSCGSSGDGPLAFHKSNPTKWGASFVWLYCHQCMSAFGTINDGLLRTYRSTPKDNSPTGRLIRGKAQPMHLFGQHLPSHHVTPPKAPQRAIGSTVAAGVQERSRTKSSQSGPISPATPSSTMSQPATRLFVSPASRSPFMNVRFSASSGGSSSTSTPSGERNHEQESTTSDEESPSAISDRGGREIQINIQMQSLEVHCLPIRIVDSTLNWRDLPQLIRDHLQSPKTNRALEVIPRPGKPWQPFGFRSATPIHPRIDIMFARIVSSVQLPVDEIIVVDDSDTDEKLFLDDDDDEEEEVQPPAKRRRRLTRQKPDHRRRSDPTD